MPFDIKDLNIQDFGSHDVVGYVGMGIGLEIIFEDTKA